MKEVESRSLSDEERDAFLKACESEGYTESGKIVELIKQFLNTTQLP